jgi:molecular chaperone DnaJ
MAKDYYSILGISKSASQDEIKKAYRKLAHQYHPDKGGGDEQRFKEVNEAYQVLGNPQKRAQYDQFGSAGFQGAPGWDFSGFGGAQGGFEVNLEDLFGDFFGGAGETRRERKERGRDILVDVEVTLEEAFRGTVKEVELRKFVKCSRCRGEGGEPGTKRVTCEKCGGSGEIKETRRTFFGLFSQVRTCPTCGGQGEYPEQACKECGGDGRVRDVESLTVPIPAGIDNGGMIKINGKGEEGARGAPAGNLIVRVSVKPHERFRREAADLFSEENISFPHAVFGETREVETIDGKVDLKIPAGIESGTLLRLKEKGMPRGNARRGDHFVKVNVVTPKKVSGKAKKLLEELRDELK